MTQPSTATTKVYQVIGGLSRVPVIGPVAQIFGLFFGLSQGKSAEQMVYDFWVSNCDNPVGTQFLPGQQLSAKAAQNPSLCVRGYVNCPTGCTPSPDHTQCYGNISMTAADLLHNGCAPHPIKTWGLPLLALGAILYVTFSRS